MFGLKKQNKIAWVGAMAWIPVLLSATFLFACQDEATGIEGNQIEVSEAEPLPKFYDETEKAQCTAKGGKLTPGFIGPVCQTPTPDAGASCQSSQDCSSGCLANADKSAGVCAAVTPTVGCFDMYHFGEVMGVCID